MKNLLIVLFISIIFVGCSQKEQIVEIDMHDKKNKIGKPIGDNYQDIEIIEEKITGLDSDVITEDEVSVFDSQRTINLAITYPSRIVGKYAKTSINTILGYLKYRNTNYNIKVFDTINESPNNLEIAFENIKNEGFTKVIALFSPNALETLHQLDTESLTVYLPLSEKSDFNDFNLNFIYGAISYTKQIEKLLEYSNINNTMIYQDSYLGKKLKLDYEEFIPVPLLTKSIKQDRNYFKGIVDDERLNGTTLFLNTDNVKTSILLSQLRAYEIVPSVILSTQQNYNPQIITLTQEEDRTNFIVANSIDKVDNKLTDTIEMYGGDIKFNWVDYSTLVGVNYLFDLNESQIILTKIEENSVLYEPKLFITTRYGFLEIK